MLDPVSTPATPRTPLATPQPRRRWPRASRIAVALVLVVASVAIWLPPLGRWLALPSATQLTPADVVIVYAGTPERTTRGLEIYNSGLVPEIWHTGYADRQVLTTDIVLKDGGVPSSAFQFLPSTSTWSDGQQIANLIRARQLHRAILVTDWWHSRRALCATEQQLQGYDLMVEYAPAPAPVGPNRWWQNAELRSDVGRELLKLGYYALRYGMSPWNC